MTSSGLAVNGANDPSTKKTDMYSTPRLSRLAAFIAVSVSLGAFMPTDRCSAADQERPNVLLICVDDLRNCLELDGDRIAE